MDDCYPVNMTTYVIFMSVYEPEVKYFHRMAEGSGDEGSEREGQGEDILQIWG